MKRTILFLLGIFFLSSLTKNFLSYRRNLSFYQNIKKEYEVEKKKNNTLKTMAVKTNDSFELEKIIRNKLNMVKPDEVMVVLPNPTPQPKVTAPTATPNYRQWWDVFFQN